MKLYHISQTTNTGYDTYSDAVVSTETEQEAKEWPIGGKYHIDSWARPEDVKVEYLGEAAEGVKGLICESFHAG
jgi:hypothetical protein